MNDYLSAVNSGQLYAIVAVVLVPLQPVLQPAIHNVVPALFGVLGMQYFSKSLKLTAGPLCLMSLLCIAVPSLATQTSTMMIPCGVLALAIAFLLWKKDQL